MANLILLRHSAVIYKDVQNVMSKLHWPAGSAGSKKKLLFNVVALKLSQVFHFTSTVDECKYERSKLFYLNNHCLIKEIT